METDTTVNNSSEADVPSHDMERESESTALTLMTSVLIGWEGEWSLLRLLVLKGELFPTLVTCHAHSDNYMLGSRK